MFALFPQLFFLAPFSALVIRVALTGTLGVTAWQQFKGNTMARVFGIVEIAAAAGIVLGMWTQAAVLVAAGLLIADLVVNDHQYLPRSTVYLALVLCFSLLVTGPGALAVDLPL